MATDSRVSAPVRVAHVVSHPIQYFAPLYRELVRRPEIDLTVYFMSDASTGRHLDPGFGREIDWGLDLLEGYRWRMPASAVGASPSGSSLRIQWDIVREIFNGRYDIVWGHGYAHATLWVVFATARLRGARAVLRDEQHLLAPRSRLRRAVKRLLLPPLFSRIDGLFIGQLNRQWLEEWGVRRDRLYSAPYVVDTTGLAAARNSLLSQREEIRSGFGLSASAPVLLFVGKMSESKGVDLLLDAFVSVRRRAPCELLLVGDGPLARAVTSQTWRESGVRWAGFLDQVALPRAYAATDCLVLPSAGETWGLVVNEALAFGLPVVVSDRVGCAPDLVGHGSNGFVFRYPDVDELAEYLFQLVSSRELRARFGRQSEHVAEAFSMPLCADALATAFIRIASAGSGSDG